MELALSLWPLGQRGFGLNILVRRLRLVQGGFMPAPFTPPNRDSLSEVDIAEGVAYEDQCTIVEGVVADGQGGWCGPADGRYDVHSFSLACWRRQGGPIVAGKLLVLRPVPPVMRFGESFDRAIFEEFPDYSIQRLNVLLSTDQNRSVFDKALKIEEPDETLLLMAERVREPVVIPTKQLGDLTLNPGIGRFEGKTKWNRKTLHVSVEQGPGDGIEDALKTAKALWSDQRGWKHKIDDFAVEKLLPLKNDDWLEEGEPIVTPKAFKARMTLQTICVSREGRFEFWHDDGDLFLGHSIQVRGNLRDGPTHADIPG